MAVVRGKKPAIDYTALEGHVRVLEKQVRVFRDAEARVKENLQRFDELDFEVFDKQNWARLNESHADDVRVIWPDGHETRGIEKHIEDLSMMFVAMPDLTITTHPVAFGSGEWTAAIGTLEGTFTTPMPPQDGKTIAPTRRRLHLSMATIARWKDGRISDEYLFWDNAAYAHQLGLDK